VHSCEFRYGISFHCELSVAKSKQRLAVQCPPHVVRSICFEDSLSIFVHLHSVEQLQQIHTTIHQKVAGTASIRRRKVSGGSDGERLFNDAMAWIAQQKVSSKYLIKQVFLSRPITMLQIIKVVPTK